MKRRLIDSDKYQVDEHDLLLLKFDENGPIDLSMYKHKITNNGCKFTYPAFKGKGQSVSKDNVAYNLIPDVDFVTNIINKGEFTIEALVYNANSDAVIMPLSKDRSGDINGWAFCVHFAYKQFATLRWPKADGIYGHYTDINPESGCWYHFCQTVKDGVSRLFINGNLVSTKNVSIPYESTNACRIFGRSYEGKGDLNNASDLMDYLRVCDVCRYTDNFTPIYFSL